MNEKQKEVIKDVLPLLYKAESTSQENEFDMTIMFDGTLKKVGFDREEFCEFVIGYVTQQLAENFDADGEVWEEWILSDGRGES